MALEVFGKLNDSGDSTGESHIFLGRKQDLKNVAKWLLEQYGNNKRQKNVLKISDAFTKGADKDDPYVRLNKKESIVFHKAITELAENKKSAALKKLINMLDLCLCVY